MRKISKKITWLIIFTIIIMQLLYTGVSAETADFSDYLDSIKDMIKENYNGQTSDESLLEGALKGMFGTMDPYTTYYTQDEARKFFEDIDGTFEGIGISMEKAGDYLVILKVFSDSPAKKAGLTPGDIILSAGGKSLVGASTDEAVSLIKGKSGTKVVLEIRRDGQAKPLKVEVTRGVITVNPVSYEINNGIGYIKLDMFNANAPQAMNQALAEMDKNKIKKIILDLRDNPGGEVNAAVSIAQKFVTKIVARLDFKSEKIKDEVYYSSLQRLNYKLAVLVNSNSASASEILAGAIQDRATGVLIGTRTFGKAKVQNLLPLLSPEAYKKYSAQTGAKIVNAYDMYNYGIIPSEDDIIGWTKITTGYYYTPSGRMIDGVGIKPDVAIADPKPAGGIDVRSLNKLGKTSQPKLNSISNEVYSAEKILKAKGYDIGTPDTKLDSKTFNAIKKYQKNSGIKSDGILNFKTQDSLNKTRTSLITQYDKQYAKAVELLSK